MPLLGRKVVPLVKPLTDVSSGETIYTIPHTEEQFRSKEEYEKRVNFYKDAVWTCQCTGHINMTHEEASRSEKENFDLLKRKFPSYFEKPVLELVHHSTDILDNLVDNAWTKLQQGFVVGEPVSLRIKAQGRTIEGTITKVDTSAVDEQKPVVNGESTTNCSSPSSDKENHSTTKVNGSPSGIGSDGDSPKKFSGSKLLPYKYSMKLKDEDKIINGIPAQDLQRQNRTPTKDLVKLFIRSFALRPGPTQTSPWVVNADLVQKYKIPNKLADIFVAMASPKNNVTTKTVEPKKRKSLLNGGPAPKKQKSESPKNTVSKTPAGVKSPVTGSPPATVTPAASGTSSGTPSSSPVKRGPGRPRIHPLKDPNSPKRPRGRPRKDGSLPGTPRKTPVKQRTPRSTPRKTPKKSTKKVDSSGGSSSEEEDIPLSNLKDGATSPEKKSPSKKTLADLKRELKKQEKKNAKAKEKAATKKQMKQMTLFDMKGAKVKSPQKTPQKGPKSPRKQQSPYKLPPLAAKLQKSMKNTNKLAFYQLLAKCARELSEKQRMKLPPELKELVQKKWESIEEKKRVANMTDAEREEYNKEKREKVKEKIRKMRLEKNMRYEDTDLDLNPLPESKLVQTPEGVPNELFGDVAMVSEFISSYSGLLLTGEQAPVTTEALLKALVSGKDGMPYLARVLSILLQTLLQDGIAEDYKEIGFHLSSLPVTGYMVGELVRLVLRKLDITGDQDEEQSIESEESFENREEEEVPEQLISQLETTDFVELTVEEKLQVLVGLCLRLMGTYSVQDYMVEKQRAATDLWKKKVAQLKQKNDRLKEEKRERMKSGGRKRAGRPRKNTPAEEEEKPDEKEKSMTISSFYGKKEETGTEDSGTEGRDLISTVKSRRLMAARAVVEKQKREVEEKVRREKDAEEQKILREKENFEKMFVEGIACAKSVFRHSPIGTDRNHSRYWIFKNAKPALYIEKGWAPPEITYNLRDSVDSSDEDIELAKLQSPSKKTSSPSKRGRPKREEVTMEEKTFPHIGQNLWFMVDEEEPLRQLLNCLHPQGIRESGLKTELQKYVEDLAKDLERKWTTHEEGIEGMETDTIQGFRVELRDMEMRLRNGGLGGVDNFIDWEKKLQTTNSIRELGECLIESQKFVMEKFLKGAFAPKVSKCEEKNKTEVKEEVKVQENGEEVEVKSEVKEELPAHKKRILLWQEAVENCPTAGRLHVLMGMLDTCIKWERSAENAKCKICRKKYEDDELILCDDCNQAFHLYCMRPALFTIPEGDWYCPSCQPRTRRSTRRELDYRKLDQGGDSSGSEDDSEEEEVNNEEECAVCGGDEGLINCSTCPSSFHMDCHDPPLRREPRSCWKCMQCISGVRLKRPKIQRRAAATRKRYAPSSDEEDSEEEERKSRASKSRRSNNQRSNSTSNRRSGGRSADVSTNVSEDEDDEEDEEEEEDEEQPQQQDEEEDEDDDETEEEEDENEKIEREMKVIDEIILRLMRHRHSWPFHEPVDAEQVPDYYEIVKTPMDLQTMRQKIKEKMYTSGQDFLDDVALMFDNAELYNKPDSDVGRCVEPCEKSFKEAKNRYLKEYQYRRDFENPKIFEDKDSSDTLDDSA